LRHIVSLCFGSLSRAVTVTTGTTTVCPFGGKHTNRVVLTEHWAALFFSTDAWLQSGRTHSDMTCLWILSCNSFSSCLVFLLMWVVMCCHSLMPWIHSWTCYRICSTNM
jgi:hypothetical protein